MKLQLRIVELEGKIANARIVDTSKLAKDKILLYSKVEMKNLKTGMIVNYVLVPESESNIVEKKISISSPIGKGLLGKKVGDVVNITIPAGIIEFEVVSISIRS